MNKTKKFLVGLLSLVVMVVCPMTLTACDKECKKHTWGEWTETTAATCTQDGLRTRTCSKCPKIDTETIAATGHSYGTVSYVWAQDNSTCTATRVCSHNASHTETETVDTVFVGVKATCDQTGYGHYKAEFANTAFTEQNTDDEDVDALGHDYEVAYDWTADKLSCTATATCKNDNQHVQVETRTSTYTEVNPATCETSGEGKFEVTFGNPLFTKQAALHTVPAKQHSYSTPIYNWEKRTDTYGNLVAVCTAAAVCQNDPTHIATETAMVNITVTDEPSCLETGNGEATVTFTNTIFGTRSENFVLEALDHDLELDAENSVEATCKANGYDRYVCKRTDCDYHKDIPTTADHEWEGVRDCDSSRHCPVCNTTEAAYGHQTVLSSELSTPKTCTENGTDYYVCTRTGCDYHYTVPTIAEGHDVTGVTPTIRPVAGEDCKYVNVYICNTCEGEVLGDTFTKHSYSASIKTPATCEQTGEKTYTCTGCGDHYDEVYAADSNAHNYIEDENNAGHFECEHCGDTKVVLGDKEEAAATVATSAITQKSEVVLSEASITLDSTTLANATGEVTMTANKFEGDDRNSILANHSDLVDQIGNKPIYNFTMQDSTGSVNFADSSVTITIPYELGTNEDVDSIYVWFLGEDGDLETFKATYHDGNIYFTTNHFSHYTVINLTPEQICEKEGAHILVETTTVQATCTSEGYTLSVCSRCGHSEKTDIVPALGHEFVVDTVNSTEATCTEAGLYKFVCTHTDCGLSYEATKPATGHSHVLNTAESTEATCSVPGTEVYTCEHNGCDNSYTVYLKTVDHEFEPVEVVPAECEKSGYTKYKCNHCDENYTEYTLALVHKYGEVGIYTPHTQTEVGYTTYTCELCDGEKVVEDSVITHIPNMEHATCEADKTCVVCLLVLESKDTVSHKFTSVYTEHTKTEVGYTTHTCTVCGHEEVKEDETIEHTLGEAVYTEHTQTHAGYTTKTCTVCGHEEVKEDETIEHTLGEAVYTEHTQTHAGYTTKTCTVCGHEEVKEDEAIEHTYSVDHATCETDKTCSVCGYVAESHLDVEHTFVDGVCSVCGEEEVSCEHGLGNNELLTVDPTCEKDGYTYYVCDDCGEEVVHETLDATGHEGDIVCLRCDEEIISLEFFASVFENMSTSTFTLTLNDVVLTFTDEGNVNTYKVNFGELYVGKNSAGKFYAAGTGEFEIAEVKYGTDVVNDMIANIVISNGNLYVKAIADEVGMNSGYNSSTGVKTTVVKTNEGVVHYAKMTLADLYSYALSSMEGDVSEVLTLETLEVVYNWYAETLTPFIENIATINEESYLKTIRIIANDLFSVDVVDGGYIFKVDSASISRLFNDVSTLSVKEYFDKRAGEGTFDNMVKDVIRMVVSGETVGDVLDSLAAKGLDVYAFIDAADVLVQSLTGMTLDQLVEMMMSLGESTEGEYEDGSGDYIIDENGNMVMTQETTEESTEEVPSFSLKAMIESYEEVELREIVLGLLSQDLEAEEVAMLESYLYPENSGTSVDDMVVTLKVMFDNSFNPYIKDMTIVELIVLLSSSNKENVESEKTPTYDENLGIDSKADDMVGEVVDESVNAMSQIAQMLAMFDEFASLGFTCTNDGYISNIFASLNIPETFETNIQINIEKDDQTDVDYDAIIAEVDAVTANGTLDANAKAEFEALGLDTVVEGGKVVEVSKKFTSTELENISVSVWGDGTIVEYKFTKFEFVYDLTNPQFAVTMGCSGVVSFENLYKITKVVSYTATEYKTYYSENGSYVREPMASFEATDEVIEGYDSFSFVYNTTTRDVSYVSVSVYFVVDNGHYYIDDFRSADFGDEYSSDDKLAHNFVEKSTKEVNDCKNGSTYVEVVYECSVCHQEKTVKTITETEGETVAHSFDDGVYTAHTKTELGYTTYTCKGCGHEEVVYDEVVEHSFDDGEYTAHTKTQAGYTTYTCEDCGHEKVMYDSTVEHNLDDGVYTAHTQTKPGYTTYTCETCGHTEVVADDVLNHNMNDGEYTEHTTTKPGYTTYTCETCGYTEVENDETINHNFVNGSCTVCHSSDCPHGLGDNELVSVDATCEEAGYTYYICDDCGDTVIHEEFEALGHAGDIVCYHCEKEILSVEFFATMLDNMKNNEFTLSISDAVLDVTVEDYDYGTSRTLLSLTFAELYFGKNSAGKFYAYGNVQITSTVEESGEKAVVQNFAGYAVIEDGKLYISATLDNVSGMGSSSSGLGDDGIIYEGDSITEIVEGNNYYIVLTLDEFADYALKMMGSEGEIPEGITLEMLETVYDWYAQTLTPLIENIYTINKTSYVETLRMMLNDLFSVEVTDNGYTFKVDSKSISRLFNDISTLSIKDYFDKRMGENAFDNMIKSVIKGVITGKTVGDVLDDLAAKGLDVYAFIDAADVLVQSLTGMTLDQLVEMMMSLGESTEGEYEDGSGDYIIDENGNMVMTQETTEESTEEVPSFSLKAMIESYEEVELREIVLGLLSQDLEAEEVAMLESYLYPENSDTPVEDMVTTLKVMFDNSFNPYIKDVTILELLVVVSTPSTDNNENLEDSNNGEYIDENKEIVNGSYSEKVETEGEVVEEEVGEVVDEFANMIAQIEQMIAMLDEFAGLGFTCTKDGYISSVYLTVTVPEMIELDVVLDITKGQVTENDYEAIVSSIKNVVETVKVDKDNVSVFETMGFVAGYNSSKELETITYTFTAEDLEYASGTDYEWSDGVEYKKVTTYTALSITYNLTDVQYMIEGGCNGFYRSNPLYFATVTASYTEEVFETIKEMDEYGNYQTVEVSLGSNTYDNRVLTDYYDIRYVVDNNSVNSIEFSVHIDNNYVNHFESDDYVYPTDRGHNYVLVNEVIPEGHKCEVIVEEYYACSDCGRKKTIYRQAGHTYKVEYVLTYEDGTCDDGIDRVTTCIDCGHTEVWEKYYTGYHYNVTIYGDREVDGFIFQVCPCDQKFYFARYNSSLYTSEYVAKDNGYSYIYSNKDGSLMVEEYYDYDLGCYTYYIYVDGEQVATYSYAK